MVFRLARVTFILGKKEHSTVVPKGITLYEASISAGIDIGSICGGRGICGKCKVRIVQGDFSPLTERERKYLSPEEIKQGYRLACQARILSDDSKVIVLLPKLMKVAILGFEPEIPLNPAVKVIDVKVEKVTLDSSHRSTLESITLNLKEEVTASLNILRKLSDKLPDNVKLIINRDLKEQRIISINHENKEIYGLAIDIGTTKVAIYIVDLQDGSVIFADAFENPQVRFGADVITRVAYAMDKGVNDLRNSLLIELNTKLRDILTKIGIKKESIVDAVIVGNTVMHHLFLGINPKKLGSSPYELVVREALRIPNKELGLYINRESYVYVPPLVGGFIGSDSVIGAFLVGLGKKEGNYLFIDIGTNSEVYVSSDSTVIATSTASGPAFEGAHITHGMRAVEGAIDHVEIVDPDSPPQISVIGNTAPQGICGSGLIDLLAELLRNGIVSPSGKLIEKSSKRVRKSNGILEYVVVKKGEQEATRDITLTLKDIRELQKAKAAVQAAVRLLSKKIGIGKPLFDRVFIAGSFGLYMDPQKGIFIGLIPEIDPDRIELVGNTAGSGARAALKSISFRKELERYVRTIKYIELAVDREFQRVFIDSIYLPSGKEELYPKTYRIIKSLGKHS